MSLNKAQLHVLSEAERLVPAELPDRDRDRLVLALAANISQRPPHRLRRAAPKMHRPGEHTTVYGGDGADAYLFHLTYRHARPGGCYLPIDSIMSARWFYGRDLYEEWEEIMDRLKDAVTAARQG